MVMPPKNPMKFYKIKCQKCDYSQTLTIEGGFNGGLLSSLLKRREQLPTKCPECGSNVDKELIPIKVVY